MLLFFKVSTRIDLCIIITLLQDSVFVCFTFTRSLSVYTLQFAVDCLFTSVGECSVMILCTVGLVVTTASSFVSLGRHLFSLHFARQCVLV